MRSFRIALAAFLLVGAMAVSAVTTTNVVVFNLADFTSQPATNRKVVIKPLSAPVGDTNTIFSLDWRTFTSDSSGMFSVSNMTPGLYSIELQSPPTLTKFTIGVSSTNETVYASTLLTTATNQTWPPSGTAYTVAASDARYSPIGAGGLAFVPQVGSQSLTNWSMLDTNALTLTSNDVITALGYAPGTGSGSGITNGQADINFVNLSLTNGGDSAAILVVAQEGPDQVWKWTPNELLAFHGVDRMLNISSAGNIDMLGDLTARHLFGEYAGNGTNLTNLNASALASGTVPVERLSGITSNELDAATWELATNTSSISGITSNQFEAATWLLATNTTPGWKLTEPGYVGGTNTFEPVYTKTQGTNLFIRGNTNSAADGLYTVQTNWTDGEATAYLYTNANADVIWSREVDLDTTYTFTNAAGLANFTEGVISPTFQSPVTNTLSGGLCGTAAFGWTTNYTFGGFGVNGSTASDGAVLAFGQGLDYTTNGAVWTIYATNISEACLSSNVWWAATNGGSSSTIYATDIVWDGSEYNFNAASLTNIDLAEVLGLYAVYSLDVGAAAYFDGAAWFTNGLTSYGDVTLSGAGSDLTVDGNINLSTPVITGTNTWRGRQVIANSDGIGPQLLISNSTTAQNGLYVTNVGIATMSMKGGAGPEFSFKSYNAQVGPNWNWISNRAALVVSQGHGLTLCSSWANGSKQNIVLAPSGYETAEATMIVSNRWTLLNGDALVTNNLSVGNTLTVTNGLKYQGTNSTGNFTAVQGIQLYNVGGTAQTITLPDATNTPPWQIYRFSSTNPLAKVTLQTAQADQFIRQWGSNTFTMVGIGESGWYHDGKNWWPASKSKMVMPVAQFSCTTNIPLTAATTNYPVTFDSTDFNNSQGIALVGGSQMWITNAGQYEFAPSVVESFDGNDVVRFWFKKEGTNVANSCTPCKGQNGSIRVVTVPFIVNVTAPTYFEIWAESDSTGETLAAQAASGNFPAGPSVICPIKKISDSYP